MAHQAESVLVPSSLLRVRQFLNKSGLKVRPWAPAEESLDALGRLLQERQADALFWERLQALLGALSSDLVRRATHLGTAVRNEVLDADQHERLLSELRVAVQRQKTPAFRALALGLSQPTLGMLCIVAGVALAGCGLTTENSSPGPSTGGSASAGAGGATDAGTEASTDAANEASAGTGGEGGAAGVDTCNLALTEILSACNADELYGRDVVSCVATLNESWQSGIRALLECKSCAEVESMLCRIFDTCSDTTLGETYSFEEFVDHCVVVLYRGVAFEE